MADEYNDLRVLASEYGAERPFMEQYLETYQNTVDSEVESVEDVFRDTAFAQLTLDIQRATGIDPATTLGMGYLNDIALDNNASAELRYVLSRLQLALAYEAMDQGEGSLNRYKANQYRKEYARLALSIGGLLTRGSASGAKSFIISM